MAHLLTIIVEHGQVEHGLCPQCVVMFNEAITLETAQQKRITEMQEAIDHYSAEADHWETKAGEQEERITELGNALRGVADAGKWRRPMPDTADVKHWIPRGTERVYDNLRLLSKLPEWTPQVNPLVDYLCAQMDSAMKNTPLRSEDWIEVPNA